MTPLLPILHQQPLAPQRHQQQGERKTRQHLIHGRLQLALAGEPRQLLCRKLHHISQLQSLFHIGTHLLRLTPDRWPQVGIKADKAAGGADRRHGGKGRLPAGRAGERDGAQMQPLPTGKRRQLGGGQKQIGTGFDQEGKGALPLLVQIHHYGRRGVLRIQHQSLCLHSFEFQHMAQEATKGISPHPPDKGTIATEPGNPHRHIGRSPARTLEITSLSIRHQIHHRIPQHPHPSVHVRTLKLNQTGQTIAKPF